MKKSLALLFSLIFFNSINSQCIQSLTAGNWSTVAVRTDGRLFAWGNKNGPYLNHGASFAINIGYDTDWESVSAGNTLCVAKKTNGSIWSYDLDSKLYQTIVSEATQIGTDTDWQTIKVGGSSLLAIKTNGTLWGMGNNYFYQLGTGDNTSHDDPIQIGTDTNWKEVYPGPFHSLGIKTDGTLWAWGQGDYGQIGDYGVADRTTPVQVGSDNQWAMATTGNEYSFGIKTDGTLWSWGRNDFGTLGSGDYNSRNRPTQLGSANNWLSVVSSGSVYNNYYLSSYFGFTIALKTDGTLWGWGQNNVNSSLFGSTPRGDLGTVMNPTQIGTANDWQKIYAGIRHIVAVKNDGTVWVWGENYSCQFGNGATFGETNIPQLVNCAAFNVLDINDVTKESIAVYPNPFNNEVIIKGLQFDVNYQILNSLGQTIQTGIAIPNSAIEVNSLSKGIYYLKINQQTIKLVKG